MTTQTQSDKDRVIVFDTTLRDGEQCPGATMTHEEKLEVAELLDDMGVDVDHRAQSLRGRSPPRSNTPVSATARPDMALALKGVSGSISATPCTL